MIAPPRGRSDTSNLRSRDRGDWWHKDKKPTIPHKTPSDHLAMLSAESVSWHEYLIAAAPKDSVENKTWKNDIFSEHDIREIMNLSVLNGCVQHVEEIQKDRKRASNKRIYIGPGKDGTTDDKIAVEVRFDSSTTKVTTPATWKAEGYKKTSWIKVDRTDDSPIWTMIEDSVPLEEVKDFQTRKPEFMVMLLHPEIQKKSKQIDDGLEWAGRDTDPGDNAAAAGASSSSTTTPGTARVLQPKGNRPSS